jgi:Domain of unknown function (DUF4917)
MKLETFDDVLASMKKNPKRPFHLLLGNGFSVAYDSKSFSYNALHNFVSNLKDDDDLSKIFEVIETRNFEVIMQYLDHFSVLIAAFGGDPALKKRVNAASTKLKNGLLEAVKALHPEHVFKVPEEQSKACAGFLKTFLNTNGHLYSTNYDLLLYWVLMRNGIVGHVDGCGRELENDTGQPMKPEDQIWSELMWGKSRDSQNVFYLHGAFQFFDNGVAVLKEEYDAFNFLLEKIGGRMKKGQYPIFLTAGDGQQKLQHITHNQYLTFSYDSLCRVKGSLVTFGFGFGPYDEHIVDAINRAAKQPIADRLRSVYIGVYSESDKAHIEQIAHKFRCKVHVYAAGTADVWGK